jgi:hypothetical protein
VAKRATVRRRRRFLILTVVLVATLSTLFVRDVLQAAHESKSNQSTLNRSFSVLANSSIREQNAIDEATMNVIEQARSITRTEFKTTMTHLSQRMDRVAESVRLLDSPTIVRSINERFVALSLNRVAAWRTVRDALEGPLRLADRPTPAATEVRTALELIRSTNAEWLSLRLALQDEPGKSVMRQSNWTMATLTDRSVAAVTTATNLKPFSAVAIGAIAIDPQPLPSRSAQIVLLPKTEVGIGVTVRNVGRAKITVDISVSTKWRHGDPLTLSARRTIPAGTATAVIFPAVPVYPGMRGSLIVHVGGAAPAWRGAATREYSVKVAPSD